MKYSSLPPDQIAVLGPADGTAIATKEVIRRFHEAFDRRDPEAMTDLVADDCVIENTNPAPVGARLVGKTACLANWQRLAGSAETGFAREEVLVVGERVVVRWRCFWGEDESQSIRGINLMRVRGGQIVEAMGYVKG